MDGNANLRFHKMRTKRQISNWDQGRKAVKVRYDKVLFITVKGTQGHDFSKYPVQRRNIDNKGGLIKQRIKMVVGIFAEYQDHTSGAGIKYTAH